MGQDSCGVPSAGDDFDGTFGVDLFNPDITLYDALKLRGGGDKRLARHGVAALLNALHPDVEYSLTKAVAIATVQAGDADMLAEANGEDSEDEDALCPLPVEVE